MERQYDPMERQEQIRELASRVAKDHVAPNAAEGDRSACFPREAIRRLGEAGLPGLTISETEGGAGEGRTCFASVMQEIARACASTALIYTSHAVVAKAIEIGGGEALKRKWLPAMLRFKSLGAFAVHEPDSGSNAGQSAREL